VTGYEFDELADQHGFVVVYPDGYKHNWNDSFESHFPAHTENIDDMGFVKGLIAREVAQRQIDENMSTSRLFHGGEMALRLACKPLSKVAESIAGASLPIPKDSSCPEQGSVPLLVVDERKTPSIRLMGQSHTLWVRLPRQSALRVPIPRTRLRSDSV